MKLSEFLRRISFRIFKPLKVKYTEKYIIYFLLLTSWKEASSKGLAPKTAVHPVLGHDIP